jgi:hypothetical protein
MFNSRKLSTWSFNVLKRVLSIFACLLFLFSFIFPFYFARSSSYFSTYWSYFWSYRYSWAGNGRLAPFGDIGHVSYEYWFLAYWFPTPSFGPHTLRILVSSLWIPLLSMFTIQVLTLLSGMISVIFNRRILLFAPVLLSLLLIGLMTCTGVMLSGYFGEFNSEYQFGYDLAFPSLVLFSAAFILNELTIKRPIEHRVDITNPHT